MSLSGVECAVTVAVRDLTAIQGYPPTLREIAFALGWSSTGTTHEYVQRLAEAGVLCVEPNQGRSVRLAPGIVISQRGQVARIVWAEQDAYPRTAEATGCPYCRGGAS